MTTKQKTWTFDINPIAASRPRVSKQGHAYFAGPYKEFRKNMDELISSLFDSEVPLYSETLLDVCVTCNVKKPKTTKLLTPRGDVDNFAKAVLDCFNGYIWDDDKHIVKLTVKKQWAEPEATGSFIIKVKELNV